MFDGCSDFTVATRSVVDAEGLEQLIDFLDQRGSSGTRCCVAPVLFADVVEQNGKGSGDVEVVVETAEELGAGSLGEWTSIGDRLRAAVPL